MVRNRNIGDSALFAYTIVLKYLPTEHKSGIRLEDCDICRHKYCLYDRIMAPLSFLFSWLLNKFTLLL